MERTGLGVGGGGRGRRREREREGREEVVNEAGDDGKPGGVTL